MHDPKMISSNAIVRRDNAPRILAALFLAAMALTGCKRNEETYVSSIVSSVGAEKLVADAAILAEQPDQEDGFPLPVNSLPASFRAFAPIETWRYDQQFFIVTARHLQHRVGAVIQPVDHPEPKNEGEIRYIRIAPGIFFCES